MKWSSGVKPGHQRGKPMGIPTLNLVTAPAELEQGVYALWLFYKGQRFPAVANWGPRPTFHEEEPVFEAHVLTEFPGLANDADQVEIETLARLRSVMSFDSSEALKAQIQKDLSQAQTYFV